MSQVKNTPIPTERRSPFPLDGKGLYTLVRKVLPFKGKDLGWGATLSIYFRNKNKKPAKHYFTGL